MSVTEAVPGAASRADRRARIDDDLRTLLLADLDDLGDEVLTQEAAWATSLARRVATLQAQLAAAVSRRAAARARAERPDVPRAAERAKREATKALATELGISAGEAGRLVRTGDLLRREPDAAAAARTGRVSPRHLQLLDETLRFVDDPGIRSSLRAELLVAAPGLSTTAFGRHCRRRLAEVDHDAAMRGEDRRWQRRSARATLTEDGMIALSGRWSGLDGETLMTGIHAFRRPDAPGERRTSEQATADAIVEMAAAALRAAEAPAQHGVRPHVLVTIDHEAVLRRTGGAADAGWSGSLPFGEIRRLLADAGVSRILTDPEGLPLEASVGKRTFPVGLYKAMLVRDGGCVRDGCDAPPAWCDGAHLHERFGPEGLGQLSLDNGALLCRVHHRELDRGQLVIEWRDGRPVAVPRPGGGASSARTGHVRRPGVRDAASDPGAPGTAAAGPATADVARERRGTYAATGPPAGGSDAPRRRSLTDPHRRRPGWCRSEAERGRAIDRPAAEPHRHAVGRPSAAPA